MFKTLYNSKHRKVVLDTKTKRVKEVILDQDTRESIAKGVHLQPYGKDDRRFFDTFKQNKKLPDGTIVNRQEHKRLKEERITEQTEDAKENWGKERKERWEKFGSTKKWH